MFEEHVTRAENNTYETLAVSWYFEVGGESYEGAVALTTIEDTAMASGISEVNGDRALAYGNGHGCGYRYTAVENMRRMFAARGVDLHIIMAEEACDRLLKLIDRN